MPLSPFFYCRSKTEEGEQTFFRLFLMHQHIITSWQSLILLLGDSAQNNNQSVDKVGLNLQQESFIVYKVSADNEFTIIIKLHLHT